MSPHKFLAHLKYATAETIRKLKDEVVTVRKGGGLPADYSLGFTNGVIMMGQRLGITGPKGDPLEFLTRETSIGKLIRPIALERGDEVWLMPEYRQKVDAVLTAAGALCEADKLPNGPERDTAFFSTIPAVLDAQNNLETFLDGMSSPPAEAAPNPEPVHVDPGASATNLPEALAALNESRNGQS